MIGKMQREKKRKKLKKTVESRFHLYLFLLLILTIFSEQRNLPFLYFLIEYNL